MERQIACVSQRVLDVVAEDPQVEHVAADVQQPAVQEHRGEDRGDRARKISGHPARAGEPARRRAELEHDRFGGPRVAAHSDGGLIEEDEHVQGDEAERDERKGLARDVVLERDYQRMGWSTTMLGRVRYRSAARETSWTVTASSARA